MTKADGIWIVMLAIALQGRGARLGEPAKILADSGLKETGGVGDLLALPFVVVVAVLRLILCGK